MDKNFRRVLYTALVVGGLMVVGASSAYAAEEGLSAPVAPVAPGATAADDGAVVGADGAAAEADAPAGAAGPQGLVGDLVGPEGIVGSLLGGDVAGVVDGTLGEDGLVDDLLTGLPSDDNEEPGTGEPGTEEPGTEQPGTDEPGTEQPGTEQPGTEEPGTEQPGTEEPGTEQPGTEEPGTDEPGTEEPGTEQPGTGNPGTDRPGHGDGHGTGPGMDRPDTSEPAADGRTDEEAGGFISGVVAAGLGFGGDLGIAAPASDVHQDHAAPAAELTSARSDAGRNLAGAGVDLSWGDRAGAVPSTFDGSYLSDGLSAGLHGTPTEPEAAAEAAPAVVPDDALAETGHMITGQLSLVSLLLGLGIAALRMRRR